MSLFFFLHLLAFYQLFYLLQSSQKWKKLLKLPLINQMVLPLLATWPELQGLCSSAPAVKCVFSFPAFLITDHTLHNGPQTIILSDTVLCLKDKKVAQKIFWFVCFL